MVNIEITGPLHSKKGYIMVAIAQALRDLGATVVLQGEDTHLADKRNADGSVIAEKLTGQEVRITELQTR
jgi:hypothetical protein